MRARRLDEIRFYLYLSATKVDMIYGQLTTKKRPFSGNVSLGVPGVQATIGTPDDEDENEYERLDTVEAALRERGMVGTIDDPKEYFAGEMRMRWGMYDDHGHRGFDEAPLVFFGGVDPAVPTLVGLGGSSRHLTGFHGASNTHSRSTTRALVRWVMAGLEDREPPGARHPEFEGERQMVMSGVGIAIANLQMPTQRLKFLAKNVLAGPVHGTEHITGYERPAGILGTPLYVIQLDHPDDEQRGGLDAEWGLPPIEEKAAHRKPKKATRRRRKK